jgi:ATP-dependent RNA helicase SUPV3L1/SUV3
MSILGCSADELGHVLKSLGFWAERRLAAHVPSTPEPAEPVEASSANGAAAATGDAHGTPVEALKISPREEAPQEPVAAAAASVADAPPALATEPAAEKWEEVWRPRRKGRAFDRSEGERRAHRARHKPGTQASETHRRVQSPAPTTMRQDAKGPLRRRDHRRQGPNPRDDRSRPHAQSSPPPAKAAFDPDSPFAALSSLKAALEKRSQD